MSVATGVCLTAAVAVGIWGKRSPESSLVDGPIQGSGAVRPIADSRVEPTLEPTKEDFSQLCDLPLRRPLYDPPPPKPEVRQLPPLQVELLGTILEGENSMAILRSEQGQVEYRRKGESVGPAESPAVLFEIQGNAVLLDRAEERITLKVNNERR